MEKVEKELNPISRKKILKIFHIYIYIVYFLKFLKICPETFFSIMLNCKRFLIKMVIDFILGPFFTN